MFARRYIKYFPRIYPMVQCDLLNHRCFQSAKLLSTMSCGFQAINKSERDIVVLNNFHQFRHKSKRSSKYVEDDDEEEKDDWDDDETLKKDSKVLRITSQSMRADMLLKSALGISRNKIEKAFYESKMRLNGNRMSKKSVSVQIGDELDLVKGFSPHNPKHIIVSRLEILEAKPLEEEIRIIVRRFKSYLIENYDDPYKEITTEE